jgi:hypothetical protein
LSFASKEKKKCIKKITKIKRKVENKHAGHIIARVEKKLLFSVLRGFSLGDCMIKIIMKKKSLWCWKSIYFNFFSLFFS